MKEERIIKSIEVSQAKEMFGSDLLEAVTDFEKAKKYLVPVLMKNTDRYNDICIINKERDTTYPDLIFKIVNNYGEGGVATIPVTNKMVKTWGVTKTDLDLLALDYIKKNFNNYTCRDMFTILEELTDDLPFPEEPEKFMKVVTSEDHLFGANIMLDPNKLASVLGAIRTKNYIIIPSSIYELIIIEEDENFSFFTLAEMIQQVNNTQVEEREQLADYPYYLRFDKTFDRWTIK